MHLISKWTTHSDYVYIFNNTSSILFYIFASHPPPTSSQHINHTKEIKIKINYLFIKINKTQFRRANNNQTSRHHVVLKHQTTTHVGINNRRMKNTLIDPLMLLIIIHSFMLILASTMMGLLWLTRLRLRNSDHRRPIRV